MAISRSTSKTRTWSADRDGINPRDAVGQRSESNQSLGRKAVVVDDMEWRELCGNVKSLVSTQRDIQEEVRRLYTTIDSWRPLSSPGDIQSSFQSRFAPTFVRPSHHSDAGRISHASAQHSYTSANLLPVWHGASLTANAMPLGRLAAPPAIMEARSSADDESQRASHISHHSHNGIGGPNSDPDQVTTVINDGCISEKTYSHSLGAGHYTLPKSWPASLRLRKGLESMKSDMNMRESYRQVMAQRTKSGENKLRHATRMLRTHGDKSWFDVLDPDSKYVTSWVLLSSLALANDVIITPYLLSWKVPLEGAWWSWAFGAAVYWTMAILLNFHVGFYLNGELKLGQMEVAKHYLFTWLVPDVTLVLVDWIVVFTEEQDTLLVRIARLIKLLRLPRMRSILDRWLEITRPEYRLSVRMAGILLGTAGFTHLMCCCWYATGHRHQTDTGVRWVDGVFDTVDGLGDDVQFAQRTVFNEVNEGFRYLTSYHWTLAQITLGAMSIEPTNSLERVFCILLLMAGMVFSATIVSIVSSQTMEYVTMRQERTERITTMRRFLEQNHIELTLQARVMKQLTQRMSKRQILLSEMEVTGALKLLSTSLRQSLLYEARAPHLLTHSLFITWDRADLLALRRLCEDATELICFKTEDTVFVAGVPAQGAYVVGKGTLRYSQDPDTSFEAQSQASNITLGAWISEAALYCTWLHVGKLEAESPSQLLIVNAGSFVQLLSRFPVVSYLTRSYARAFHLRVVSAKRPYSQWPSDVKIPHTDPSELLSPDVGLELLQYSIKEGKLVLSSVELEQLHKEISTERCSVHMDEAGELQRIVAVVAIRLVREDDGRSLMEVGTWDEKKGIKVGITLPGRKRPRGELPLETFETIKGDLLAPFAWGMEPHGADDTVEVKTGSYGLLTRYLRTEHQVGLKAEFATPPSMITPPMGVAPPIDSDIFMRKCHDKVHLLCWLSEDDHIWLTQSPEGEKALKEWVGAVDVPGQLDTPEGGSPDASQAVALTTGVESGVMEVRKMPVQERTPSFNGARSGKVGDGYWQFDF